LHIIYPCNKRETIVRPCMKIYAFSIPQHPFLNNAVFKRILQFYKSWKIASSILKRNPSIGYIYGMGYTSILSSRLAQRHHKKHITRLFGTFLGQTMLDFDIKHLPYLPKYSLEKLAWKAPTDLLVVTNDGTQGDAVAKKLGIQSRKFMFLVNGVDRVTIDELINKYPDYSNIREKLSLPRKAFIVTSVSRLARWKRVDLVIKTFAKFVKKGPYNKILLIIGYPSSAYSSLRDLVNELKVEKNIYFLGNLPHTKTLEYMYASDVLMSFYEVSNVGAVLLESISLGKTIMARDVGDTHKFIRHMETGILVKDGKNENIFVKSTTEFLSFLYSNPKLIKKIGQNAHEYSKRNLWSWEERIKYEYEKVVSL
jgi:glycosyltransferase involved in cell wall biosynthesis